MEQKKILIRSALLHAATVLTKISFVYRAKKVCLCHHHYAGNPVEGHKFPASEEKLQERRGEKRAGEREKSKSQVRQILIEQLKCFDNRTEGKLLFLADMQEFFRRLSEIEMEYSRNLERLSKMYLDKLHRHRTQRKEKGTTMDLWQQVLIETKNKSKMHQGLSENVSSNIVNRFMIISDDCQRISKQCRETATTLQEELVRSVQELSRKVHRYHAIALESKTAEQKLQKMEDSRRKNEKMAKQVEKHQQKSTECKKRCVKAKNEYVLSLESTNRFLENYYNGFLKTLVDTFDYNYHDSFTRGIEAYVTAEAYAAGSIIQSVDGVREAKLSVEATKDKQLFFDDNAGTLVLPFTFAFLPYNDEELYQVSPQQIDVIEHHYRVFERLQKAKAETEEIGKSAEATSDALCEMHRQWDNEMMKLDNGEVEPAAGTASCQSIKNSSEDLELYYIAKMRELILTSSLKVRVEAENDMLTKTLGEVTADIVGARLKRPALDMSSKEASAILDSVHKKTKVFGCNLENYVKITGREIPEVVESCVKFIKKFGLEHQGIFRLSGSTTEINDMKQLFENGRDPLAGLNHWKDINAVAGLLRVYFRELEDPLFPSSHYQEFIKASLSASVEDGIKEIVTALNSLPESVVRVMEYLFSFLSLVSEHSDSNKMDAHNLAVVFGPTLLRIPSEQDMIAYQSQVNGMIELFIKHCDEIFPGSGEPLPAPLSETEESESEEGE
ncbi:SLIT-ROBO Rho GTPase-activating protein 1 [Stylophora pistillata]|uniref:SLIT-ROBO Rho GTPase-activating protein 1 n=1 Tax=Stylophora pistillata TaxID=50429 RepID=A0A2B4RE46_STYPI|nr:SLIT-ROBO Rho GTPase-activating protein 1 [Stylophora pistillata]